jgi:hypothetical protein
LRTDLPVNPVLADEDNDNKTNPTLRAAFSVVPILPGDENGNENNQPGGLALQ